MFQGPTLSISLVIYTIFLGAVGWERVGVPKIILKSSKFIFWEWRQLKNWSLGEAVDPGSYNYLNSLTGDWKTVPVKANAIFICKIYILYTKCKLSLTFLKINFECCNEKVKGEYLLLFSWDKSSCSLSLSYNSLKHSFAQLVNQSIITHRLTHPPKMPSLILGPWNT